MISSYFMQISCLIYSTLKTETYSSETSVDFQGTRLRCNALEPVLTTAVRTSHPACFPPPQTETTVSCTCELCSYSGSFKWSGLLLNISLVKRRAGCIPPRGNTQHVRDKRSPSLWRLLVYDPWECEICRSQQNLVFQDYTVRNCNCLTFS
jgi:hypothetical protein